jgi:hypothetical protein
MPQRAARLGHAWAIAIALCLSAFAAPAVAAPPVTAWSATLTGGQAALAYSGTRATLDAAGNVYVLGRVDNGVNHDYLTVKYDSAGVELWRAVANGAANAEDEPAGIAVDGQGNVFVTGTSANEDRNLPGLDRRPDILTVKYDAAGSEMWRATAKGRAATHRALALDDEGSAFVLGLSGEAPGSLLLIKYRSDGSEQ